MKRDIITFFKGFGYLEESHKKGESVFTSKKDINANLLKDALHSPYFGLAELKAIVEREFLSTALTETLNEIKRNAKPDLAESKKVQYENICFYVAGLGAVSFLKETGFLETKEEDEAIVPGKLAGIMFGAPVFIDLTKKYEDLEVLCAAGRPTKPVMSLEMSGEIWEMCFRFPKELIFSKFNADFPAIFEDTYASYWLKAFELRVDEAFRWSQLGAKTVNKLDFSIEFLKFKSRNIAYSPEDLVLLNRIQEKLLTLYKS